MRRWYDFQSWLGRTTDSAKSGVVRKTADRVYVMQGGKMVESGNTSQIFETPAETYTRTLIESEPKARRAAANDAVHDTEARDDQREAAQSDQGRVEVETR